MAATAATVHVATTAAAADTNHARGNRASTTDRAHHYGAPLSVLGLPVRAGHFPSTQAQPFRFRRARCPGWYNGEAGPAAAASQRAGGTHDGRIASTPATDGRRPGAARHGVAVAPGCAPGPRRWRRNPTRRNAPSRSCRRNTRSSPRASRSIRTTSSRSRSPARISPTASPWTNTASPNASAPARRVTFEFRADHPGTFRFYCNLKQDERCKEMKGELVVHPK